VNRPLEAWCLELVTDPRSQDAVQLITSEPTCDQGSGVIAILPR